MLDIASKSGGYWRGLFVTIRHYLPLFAIVRHYLPLFAIVRHYSHYSGLFALFGAIRYLGFPDALSLHGLCFGDNHQW